MLIIKNKNARDNSKLHTKGGQFADMKYFIHHLAKNPPSFLAMGKLMATTPFVHSDHTNPDYLLILGIEGELHLQIEERKVTLRPREILLIPPGVRHFGTEPSKKLTFFWCHFDLVGQSSAMTEEDAKQLCVKDEAVWKNGVGEFLLPFHDLPSVPQRLLILLQQMQDASSQQRRSKGVVNSLLAALLYEITEQTVSGFLSDISEAESLCFNEIVQWIRIHVYTPLTVQDVAKKFRYNPNYISSVFHQKTGYSLGQFITNTKMYAAKELLLTTNKTIKEIAAMLAYGDVRYFVRCFKKHENVTPTVYRNTYSTVRMNTLWLPKLEENS